MVVMSRQPDLKVVVDNKTREPPVPLPERRPHNDLLQTILGFAISLPLWGLIGWIVWMWWTGRV
jgi:hypothetical protein